MIGVGADLTYDYKHLGTDRAALVKAAEGAEAFGKPAIVIVGQGALTDPGGAAVLEPLGPAGAYCFNRTTRRFLSAIMSASENGSLIISPLL